MMSMPLMEPPRLSDKHVRKMGKGDEFIPKFGPNANANNAAITSSRRPQTCQ